MKCSEQIDKIAQALCAIQVEIHDAPKESQAYNYKYANLGTILELTRPVLHKNGLAIIQFPVSEGDKVGVCSRVLHTSGQWMEDTVLFGVNASQKMSIAQQSGSVISYARRYSIAAIAGITQIDDDAAIAEQSAPAKPQKAAAPGRPSSVPATEEQYASINEYVAAQKIPERRLAWLKIEKNWNNMTQSQATTIINECKELGK